MLPSTTVEGDKPVAIKRAKIIDAKQFDRLLREIAGSEHELRDEVALRLSYFAGLRAAEIANLRWDRNILGSDGKIMRDLHITSDVGKRSVERTIPFDPKLRAALVKLRKSRPDDVYVFHAIHNNTVPVDERGAPRTEQGQVTPNAVVQWFRRLYDRAGFKGCTSHSGRRTFITTRARTANLQGCSIVDVQRLAGHLRLETTGTYVESSPQQRKLVAAWG
jgi:integrase